MKKPLFLLFVLIILSGIFWWLGADKDVTFSKSIPQDQVISDSSEYEEEISDEIIETDTGYFEKRTEEIGGGILESNSLALIDHKPIGGKVVEKAEFVGKNFTRCLSLIYALPGTNIVKIENRAEGTQLINFWLGNTHHVLYFNQEICSEDEILKK